MRSVSDYFNKRRIYVVRGTIWRQGKLRLDEAFEMLQLFNQDYTAPEGKDFSVAALIDHLITTGILQKGIAIILKPFPGLGLWNRLVLVLHGYKRDEVARLFTIEGLAIPINDFFLLSAESTRGYLVFAKSSYLTGPTVSLIPGLLSLSNPLWDSLGETSKSRPGL